MKKINTLSLICIIASILFSSCRSNMSVTKRHYNNGYYITHAKNKHTIVKQKEEEQAVQASAKKPIYTVHGRTEQSAVTENNDVVASNEKPTVGVISHHTQRQPLQYTSKIGLTPVIKNKPKQFSIKKIVNDGGDRDGLSLFWIVILVILILWALGFLAGGFGLGGLINILLVIALILLILWLLRIL